METVALGNISYSCLSPYFGKTELEIFRQNFYLQINGKQLRIVDEEIDKSFVSRTDHVLEQDKRFIQAIESGRPDEVLCDYSEALRTLEATLEANKSAMKKH